MNLTDYQAKYFAHELTRRFPPDSVEKSRSPLQAHRLTLILIKSMLLYLHLDHHFPEVRCWLDVLLCATKQRELSAKGTNEESSAVQRIRHKR